MFAYLLYKLVLWMTPAGILSTVVSQSLKGTGYASRGTKMSGSEPSQDLVSHSVLWHLVKPGFPFAIK